MKQLHPGAKWLFRVGLYAKALAVILLLCFLLIGLSTSMPDEKNIILTSAIWLIILLPLVLIIFGEIFSRLSYRFWKYEFGSNQLRIEKGIIWKKYSNIPYAKVQNVDITRGIIARLCKFSSVNIQTAGYSGIPTSNHPFYSEGYIPAVSIEEAEKIREEVIKKISKKSSSR